jgi:hypothetical protein
MDETNRVTVLLLLLEDGEYLLREETYFYARYFVSVLPPSLPRKNKSRP